MDRYPQDGEGWYFLGDVRFHDYLDRLRAMADREAAEPYERWSRIRWEPSDSAAIHLGGVLGAEGMFASQAPLEAAVLDPDVEPATILDASGRLGALEEDAALAVQLEVRSVLGGLAPPSFADRARSHLEERASESRSVYWLSLLDVHSGSPERARERLRRRTGSAGDLRALLSAADGWAAIAAGDTLAGVRRLEEGIEGHGYLAPPQAVALRHVWAETVASMPDRRTEGVRRLRHGSAVNEFLVPNRLALGRTLERMGDPEGARKAYRDVVRILDGADPAAFAQLEDARLALERLARR